MTPAQYWKIRALEGDAERLHTALKTAEARLLAAYKAAGLDPSKTYVRHDDTATMIEQETR